MNAFEAISVESPLLGLVRCSSTRLTYRNFYSRDSFLQWNSTRELNELFLPGWRCISTTREREDTGDCFIAKFFRCPVSVWWVDGQVADAHRIPHASSLKITEKDFKMAEKESRHYGN